MGENTQNSLREEEDQQEDMKRLFFKYLQYWKWFVVGVVAALVVAFIYMLYATQVYHTEAEIKILKDQEQGLDLSGMEGNGGSLLGLNEVNLDNEIEILQSRKILDSVVKSLNLTTRYYNEDDIKTVEVWKDEKPFRIKWTKTDSLFTKDELPLFSLTFESDSRFKIAVENYEGEQEAKFYDTINMLGAAFVVELNPAYKEEFEELKGSRYTFQKVPKNAAIDGLKSKLEIQQVGKESDILNIAYSGSNKAKSQAVIDSLISKFNMDGIYDKQLVSKRTEEFIDQRLQSLFAELDTVESGLVDYKQAHGIVTIESTAEQLFGKTTHSEKQRFEKETQLELAKAFKSELTNGEDYTLLPANLGIESESINNLTKEYNQTALMRYERLTSATAQNPLIINLQDRLDSLKKNILKSINGYIKDLNIALNNFRKKEERSSGKLHNIPQKEKGVRGIQRQQEVKEKLYLFLLQKREQAALQYATTAPSIKVVDFAYTNPIAISPKKKIIFLAALILGGLIPFGLLYLRFLFDTKVKSKEDIERVLPNVPILAEIPQLSKSVDKLITQNDRSNLAEAFRILRTNLSFIKGKLIRKPGAKTIFVTSTIKGEGKTFVALNTAHALASTGKKVLLIGADLRNPQTHNYYGKTKESIGVSSFLSGATDNFDELLHTGDNYFTNLHLIISGHIPPNPAELLMNGRFEVLLAEAQNRYDYIIVDTAPTILVTDTFLISQNADATLYLTRADHTEIKLLNHIKEVTRTEKLRNVGIVLNGLDLKSGYGYNYGYGYGYSEDYNHPWWMFWKK